MKSSKYKKILLVAINRLGDVVLTTPAVKALRSAYPDAYIAMVVKPDTALAVKGNPCLDEVIVYDKNGRHKSIIGSISFAMALKKKKFDLAVIFDPSNRSHIIPYLAGIPRRIGYDENLPFLLTDRIKNTKYEGKKHETEYNLDLLKVLGIDAQDKMPFVCVDAHAAKFIDEVFIKNGIGKGDKIITIHPGASCPSKTWPAEKFAEVADKLIEKYGVKVVVLGGNDETGTSCVNAVSKFMSQKALFLSKGLNLGQRIAIIKRSTLFISNDSGPAHVAVAVRTPVVAIFGRNQPGLGPTRWGPLGPNDIVIHKDVGCFGICLAHNCKKSFECLRSIRVDEVFSAIEKMGYLKG